MMQFQHRCDVIVAMVIYLCIAYPLEWSSHIRLHTDRNSPNAYQFSNLIRNQNDMIFSMYCHHVLICRKSISVKKTQNYIVPLGSGKLFFFSYFSLEKSKHPLCPCFMAIPFEMNTEMPLNIGPVVHVFAQTT